MPGKNKNDDLNTYSFPNASCPSVLVQAGFVRVDRRTFAKLQKPSNKRESGYLEIYNIQGAKTGTVNIQEGSNQVPLGNLLPQSGIYIYKVFVNGEIKNTSKLVKIQ